MHGGLATDEEPKPLLPPGYDCRSRVHEYGGGSFVVDKNLLVFSNDDDFRLYVLKDNDSTPTPVTPDTGKKHRYADLAVDPEHRFVVCVREEHFDNEEPKDVVNTLVVVCLETHQTKVIASGADFYSSPRLCNDALAYVSWMHSNLPWDSTRLHYVPLDADKKPPATEGEEKNIVAGNAVVESIVASSRPSLDPVFFRMLMNSV